jgi:hypothetical protein
MRPVVIFVGCLVIAACSSGTAPRVPTQVAFVAQPTSVVAGQTLAPVQVAIQDASGNVVTSARTTVTLAFAAHPSGSMLQGTLAASAVNGVASFPTLIINTAASGYRLEATTGTFAPVTSITFAVKPGPASRLAFTAQPAAVAAGEPITHPVQVTALDAEGNVATGFTGTVALALGTNPGAATLSGTLSGVAAAGVASFPNLLINNAGTGYTFMASAGTLDGTSLPFIVGTTGIDYFGGPVIYTPKVAALYWSSSVIYNGAPTPGTHAAPPSADQSIVGYFLNHIGGSPYYNITATYFDATYTYVQNVTTYTQYWADTTGPSTTTPTDADIQAEVESAFTDGTLTYDPSTLYAVFTGTGVNLGGGFGTSYCAYHSYFVDGSGRNVKYAAMPYANDYLIGNGVAGCSLVNYYGSANNDRPADAEVNLLAHELAETITDENLNAWFTSSGNEMADQCAWSFGSTYTTSNGSFVNEALGSKNFLLQMLWVNAVTSDGAAAGCQQSWTPAARPGGRAPPRAVIASLSPNAPTRHVMHMYRGP